MKIGKITFLKTTLLFTSWLVLPIALKIEQESSGFLFSLLFTLLFYFTIVLGFGQIFYFKENELVVWYFNPLKKSVHIPYKSIVNVDIFRYMPSFVINVFHFKTAAGEVIINNNIFSKYELKKIKKYFESKGIECDI